MPNREDHHREAHLAPMTDELLHLAIRGLELPEKPRVLDLCCGLGGASRLMAREYGAGCTGIDNSEELLRIARERTLAEGLDELVDFRDGDARHIELTNGIFDLVLGLGGTLSYIGRPEGLERIRQLLKPGGALLFTDLIYLDSPAPEEVVRVLEEKAPGNEPKALKLEPAVRAVFEEGVFRFETEHSYRALLHGFGYDVVYTFPVPESGWNAYYRMCAENMLDPTIEPRIPVEADELASVYSWGGRWGIGYLVCGARVRAEGS